MLDASVAVAAALPDEDGAEQAHTLMLRAEAEGVVVPAIWPTELANALLAAARRQRLPIENVVLALARLVPLRVEVAVVDPAALWQGPVQAAIRHRLSVYDATYLDLALRCGLPLASFDGALRRAAAAEGLSVLP